MCLQGVCQKLLMIVQLNPISLGCLQGNIDALTEPQSALGEKVEAADLFTGENVKTFARADMEALAKGENREKSSIVVLYAPWCSFSQVCISMSNFGCQQ